MERPTKGIKDIIIASCLLFQSFYRALARSQIFATYSWTNDALVGSNPEIDWWYSFRLWPTQFNFRRLHLLKFRQPPKLCITDGVWPTIFNYAPQDFFDALNYTFQVHIGHRSSLRTLGPTFSTLLLVRDSGAEGGGEATGAKLPEPGSKGQFYNDWVTARVWK